jgi:hypothetical protein
VDHRGNPAYHLAQPEIIGKVIGGLLLFFAYYVTLILGKKNDFELQENS